MKSDHEYERLMNMNDIDTHTCKECGSEDNAPRFDDSEFDGDQFLIAFRCEVYDCGQEWGIPYKRISLGDVVPPRHIGGRS